MSDVFRALKEISLEVCESYYVCVLSPTLWLKKIVMTKTENRQRVEIFGIVYCRRPLEISSTSDSKITLRSLSVKLLPKSKRKLKKKE